MIGRWLLLFTVWPLLATTYTVKSGGGGNYTTIQACATAMASGDTCVVYAGTYSESPSVPSGGVSNYKTITVNGTDVVTVTGFTLGSHTKLVGNCPNPAVAGNAGTCGFTIGNGGSATGSICVNVGSSTDVYVVQNTLAFCGSGKMIAMASGSSYVYIQANTLYYPCRTVASGTSCDGIEPLGTNELIEGNDIAHYRLGINYNGSYGIFRNNNCHDQLENDSGQHTDCFFSEPGSGAQAQYHVIEGNTQNNAVGPNAKGTLTQGDTCSGNCYNVIIRFNTWEHIDSAIVVDENAGSSNNPGFYNVKMYNNSMVDVGRITSPASGIIDNYACYSVNPADVNNIYYWPGAVTVLNAYAADSACGNTVRSTFYYGHNLAYCNTSAGCPLKGFVYNSGSFQSDPGNLWGYSTASPTNNPLFVNYSTNDFYLQAGSPALNAGTYLTTVASGDSGFGTSLVVNDAAYFQDGYGLTNANSTVSGDCISVTTVGNHVCVTAVNYSTNTLTLATGITRSSGDSIWLYSDSGGIVRLTGSAPNIGAFGQQTSNTGSSCSGCTLGGGVRLQ